MLTAFGRWQCTIQAVQMQPLPLLPCTPHTMPNLVCCCRYAITVWFARKRQPQSTENAGPLPSQPSAAPSVSCSHSTAQCSTCQDRHTANEAGSMPSGECRAQPPTDDAADSCASEVSDSAEPRSDRDADRKEAAGFSAANSDDKGAQESSSAAAAEAAAAAAASQGAQQSACQDTASNVQADLQPDDRQGASTTEHSSEPNRDAEAARVAEEARDAERPRDAEARHPLQHNDACIANDAIPLHRTAQPPEEPVPAPAADPSVDSSTPQTTATANDTQHGAAAPQRQITRPGHIFVSIAAYRDPECQWTMHSLFQQADKPDQVCVGVVWQIDAVEDAAFVRVAGADKRPRQVYQLEASVRLHWMYM